MLAWVGVTTFFNILWMVKREISQIDFCVEYECIKETLYWTASYYWLHKGKWRKVILWQSKSSVTETGRLLVYACVHSPRTWYSMQFRDKMIHVHLNTLYLMTHQPLYRSIFNFAERVDVLVLLKDTRCLYHCLWLQRTACIPESNGWWKCKPRCPPSTCLNLLVWIVNYRFWFFFPFKTINEPENDNTDLRPEILYTNM